MNNFKTFIYPIATLSGTIIGVGIFSLPYITLKAGTWLVLGYFLILGSLVALIHLFFSEVALKTPDFLRLPGYARIYLGSWGKIAALVATISGFLGAILAYIIIGGEFLTNLLSPIFGGGNTLYTLLYFSIGAALIFLGIRIISKIEFLGLALFFLILIAILFRSLPIFKVADVFWETNWAWSFFLPYGPILFALWGADLIPEVEEMLGKNKRLLKKIVLTATLISILIYLFFIFLILGITGPQTSQEAISGLKNYLGGGIVSLAFFFGLWTTFTSFIALGLTLRKIFWYDLKIDKNLAWLITCFIPLTLFFIGVKSFIPVISFVGGIAIGIEGILILLMYQKIKPERKFLILPLALIFLGGIIYEIIYFLK